MLSYQHAYHAGGAADVHKHAVLLALLGRLRQKEKPFAVLDLYAGEGVYALTRPEAAKTGEFESGISKIWKDPPAALTDLVDVVRALNPGAMLNLYPGSPAVIGAKLRADDRLILNELHPRAAVALRRWAGNDPRISIHVRDAREALSALVPPPIRRGLVLLDPSYEERGEYGALAEGVVDAMTKWPQAGYAVWFPLLADGRHNVLISGLAQLPYPLLISELRLAKRGLSDAPELGLRGSAMALINPPWRFEEDLAPIGAALGARLGDAASAHRLTWVTRPAA